VVDPGATGALESAVSKVNPQAEQTRR
jgi:hypothetical protein